MRRAKTMVAGGAAALMAFSGVLAVAPAAGAQEGDVGARHYSCGSSRPPNRDTQGSDGVWPRAIRDMVAESGSAYSCGDLGLILHYDRLDYYCHTQGNDGQWWTYVSAFDWGIAGWVPNKSLKEPGSLAGC
ncbi:hypothetical protein [Saccharothrix xinjiangensis]|uniref:SH3 domain-containing protein n=1 Tax=Saccharothrix xinjiangensis TaxID=204798 RepID=A0ABV9Y843_9PSEU